MLPIDELPDDSAEDGASDIDPVMLLALNSTASVTWEELEFKVSAALSSDELSPKRCPLTRDAKARELAKHLRKPVSELRGRLAAAPVLHVSPRPERTAR